MTSVRLATAIAAGALIAGATVAQAETITIATVNNSDMIIMQRLSTAFEQQTGHELNWVVLEENVLRQRVTTDIATGGDARVLFGDDELIDRIVPDLTLLGIGAAARPRRMMTTRSQRRRISSRSSEMKTTATPSRASWSICA